MNKTVKYLGIVALSITANSGSRAHRPHRAQTGRGSENRVRRYWRRSDEVPRVRKPACG